MNARARILLPPRAPDWQWPARWHGTASMVRLPPRVAPHLRLAVNVAQGACVSTPRAARWRTHGLSGRQIVLELANRDRIG